MASNPRTLDPTTLGVTTVNRTLAPDGPPPTKAKGKGIDKGPAPTGRLRKGYVIRMGKYTMQYPDVITLTREAAVLYLHMFDNREEIQEYFDLPRDPKFPTPEEMIKQSIELARRQGKVAGSSLAPGSEGQGARPVNINSLIKDPRVVALIDGEVKKRMRDVTKTNEELIARLEVLEGIIYGAGQEVAAAGAAVETEGGAEGTGEVAPDAPEGAEEEGEPTDTEEGGEGTEGQGEGAE